MTTDKLRSEKRIALKHVSTAWFAGVDEDGAYHFWSYRNRTMVVVEDGDAEIWHLDKTPFDSPAEWRDHVSDRRGWEDCRIGGSIIESESEVVA